MRVDRGRVRSPVDRPEAVWLADSEWRRFVAFGGVGVVECALGFDALGAGFTAGASSFGHHQSAVLGGFDRGGWRCSQITKGPHLCGPFVVELTVLFRVSSVSSEFGSST